MFVIGKNHIINEWEDSPVNAKRVANSAYGVVLYTGEIEKSENGSLYEKGFLPVLSDEAKSEKIRKKRNYLLAVSDWTQIPDSSIDCKEKWQKYRQCLRDLPAQPGFPRNVKWPEKP
ncbi:MAG: phage tail assembly chaperone [Alphaproteobacteria bacterium]|nr:phage tail assembly chaperone [Alphaproteobacteria bacterium]